MVHVVSAVRPFRFCAPMPVLRDDPGVWRDEVRRIEDWGFSSVSVSEHITGGWTMDPWTVMTAAAEATTSLRILSTVLVNDFRHPVLLHRAAATLDRLSGGRLEVGLGAGWSPEDYAALGLPFDPPGRRIARLDEGVRIFKRLCAGEAVDQDGPAYVAHIEAPTPTVQRPHPPVLIGGGGRRVLELAAREADIVGVHARLPVEGVTPETARDLGAPEFTSKLGWVRDAAAAAGRALDSIELQVNVYLCEIGAVAPRPGGSRWASVLASDATLVRESPAVLIGSVEACADLLEERRARFGFSYIRLGCDPAAAAPLVARLSGR